MKDAVEVIKHSLFGDVLVLVVFLPLQLCLIANAISFLIVSVEIVDGKALRSRGIKFRSGIISVIRTVNSLPELMTYSQRRTYL